MDKLVDVIILLAFGSVSERIDSVLLILVPFELLFKSVFMGAFGVRMLRQDSRTPLGVWLISMYLFMCGGNLTLSILFGRFAYLWWDVDTSAWVLFMLPLNILTIAVVVCAYNVMVWSVRVDRMLALPGNDQQIADMIHRNRMRPTHE